MAKADKISGIRGMEDILPAEAVFLLKLSRQLAKSVLITTLVKFAPQLLSLPVFLSAELAKAMT